MKLRFRREKEPVEQAQEPVSLAEHPLLKEGKLGALIAIPILSVFMLLIILAKTILMTQEFFMMLMGAGLAFVTMMLIVYYSLSKQQALSFDLYQREFGFTSRLRPRFEIYCQPEGVQTLIAKNDKIINLEDLQARLMKYGLEEIGKKFTKDTTFTKYLHYFPHVNIHQGWDAKTRQVQTFKAHFLFTDFPHKEQFVFGAGQDNWWGAIMYNHTHAESDNVKVLGWGIDPFTSLPIPICELIHASVVYDREQDKDQDRLKTEEAYQMVIANQHNIIDTQRSEVSTLRKLLEGKFDKFKNLLQVGQQIGNTDVGFFMRVMRDRNPHRWKSVGKVFLYALIVAGILGVLLIGLHYFNVIVIPFLQ